MKKNTRRILGRKLATELTASKLEAIHGGAQQLAVDTWTTSNPPDKDSTGSGGPIWV